MTESKHIMWGCRGSPPEKMFVTSLMTLMESKASWRPGAPSKDRIVGAENVLTCLLSKPSLDSLNKR